MGADPLVDLIFSHFTPRYVATGVDPNDLARLASRIERWDDWCREWSAEAARHEQLAEQARARGRQVTATEASLRAAIYYHYAKHLFADRPEEYRPAHERMLACYAAAATGSAPPMERLEVPFEGGVLPGWLRRPSGAARPPLAILLPGLDACKEELHAWSNAFVRRGVATLTLDGPGQGETAFWQRIRCPLLIVFGAGDRIIPPAEGERLARAAGGPTELVVFEDGNHVCFNISYKFRPLTADWLAEQLGA